MNLRSITLLVLTVFVVGVLGWVVLSGPPSAGTVTETENQESLSPLDAAVVDSATSREDQVVGVHSKQGYSGSVLDKNGKAIPGAWVALIAPTPFGDWGMQRTDLLDKSGERQSCGLGGNFFLAAKEGSGPWQVLAGAPGFGVQRSGEMTSWLTGSAATFVLQPEVEVEGRVVLEKGDAVAEAVVQLRALRGTRLDGMPNVVRTDSTGSFRVVAPQAGTYQLHIRSAIAPDTLIEDVLVQEAMSPLLVKLKAQPEWTLTLQDDEGNPIEGALVSLSALRSPASQPPKAGRSNESGVVSFGDLKGETWKVQVLAEEFCEMQRQWSPSEDGVSSIWQLVRPASLTLRVTNRDGVPVVGQPVRRVGPSGLPWRDVAPRSLESDQDGLIGWEGIPPGVVTFLAGGRTAGVRDEQAEEGGSQSPPKSSLRVDLQAGEQSADLLLDGHFAVRLQLIQAGLPVNGALVQLIEQSRSGGGSRSVSLESNADGFAAFPAIFPGTYAVRVTLHGSSMEATQIRVRDSDLSQVVALPGGGLRGRVLVDGMPASAGEVLVRIPGGGEQLLAVQEDGRFATYLVPAGSFEFSIAIPGFLIWESVTMTSDGLSFIEYGDIAVSRAGLLEGVVENLPPGGGFKVRYIELYDSQGALLNSFPLENSPRFRFVDLTPGSYRLVVKIGIRPLIEEIVQVVPGKNFHKMAL